MYWKASAMDWMKSSWRMVVMSGTAGTGAGLSQIRPCAVALELVRVVSTEQVDLPAVLRLELPQPPLVAQPLLPVDLQQALEHHQPPRAMCGRFHLAVEEVRIAAMDHPAVAVLHRHPAM